MNRSNSLAIKVDIKGQYVDFWDSLADNTD